MKIVMATRRIFSTVNDTISGDVQLKPKAEQVIIKKQGPGLLFRIDQFFMRILTNRHDQ